MDTSTIKHGILDYPNKPIRARVKCVKQSSFFLFFSFSEININNKTKRPSNIWRVNKSTTQIYLLEELDSFLYNYSAWVEWVCFGQWLSIRSLEEFCVIPIQKRERGGGEGGGGVPGGRDKETHIHLWLFLL